MGGAVNRSSQQLNEWLQDSADQQEMTVYCQMCPKWRLTAPAQQARAAAQKHREEKHPELIGKKPIARRRRVFSQSMTQEREEQINEERRQRMRSLGIS